MGKVKHPPFDKRIRKIIRHIQKTFAEHDKRSVKVWEDGFRSDTHPEKEIAYWSHAADIYKEFASGEVSHERCADIYRCIVTCLITITPESVWHVFKPTVLSRAEAEQIVNRYYGKNT